MKPTYQTQPLGVLRPASQHSHHELQIILKGNDGTSWSTWFDFNTRDSAPRRFLILELPSQVVKPGGDMVQLSATQSELIVQLQGPASEALLKDLSATPIQDWMSTLFTCFAEAKAAIGILITNGQVSVTLHEGE